MNILIIGSGGREHTLAWKLNQSPKLNKLFIAPGNAGTAAIGRNIAIDVNDFNAIKEVVLKEGIKMVVVGPEDPLVNGIHDFFLEDASLKGVSVIGPRKMAATLEGSKEYAKKFMIKHNIPTASYKSFTANEIEEGLKFLETINPPFVLKADGLAAGKGVLIIQNLEEAKKELQEMLISAKFGSASSVVVIEEYLSGIELSCFVLTDGENYKVLPMAKDYKRIGEGDTGLNTGGMGAISPVPFVTNEFLEKVHERIIKPTIDGLIIDQLPYKGFIFIGLIKVGDDPFVIEYNVRLGDPETEVVLPRIKNDLVELFEAVANGNLDSIDLQIDERTATTVMLVSGGYPQAYKKGIEIEGIENVDESIVFHAGTQIKDNKILTSGGRVMAVTSFGKDFREGLQKSYQNIDKIHFDHMYYRKDLGFDL